MTDFYEKLDEQEKAMGEANATPMTYNRQTGVLWINGLPYQCKSGPWGKGALPAGEYDVGKLAMLNPETCAEGFVYEKTAFWIPITPRFETDRTGLGIHPDGNVPGTLGCIGLQRGEAVSFLRVYQAMGIKPMFLIVK